MSYRGLTWDHPRGFTALDAAARQARDLGLSWDRHSLEGFETHPIGDLCARYDLVVLDHPHVGEAVAVNALRPLEDIFDARDIAGWRDTCIGATLASYHFAGRHWALPLDAATQVMASRRDLIDVIPGTWDEVVALSQRAPVALSLAGPHAALSFQSICVSLGEAPATIDPDVFVSRATGETAFDLMAHLAARAPATVADKNPIGILQHMCEHDDVALCPLVYGYVNYAARLAFTDAPRGPGGIGSTLGGTGIGISARCEVTPALKAHLRWLMSPEAQIGFIPAHDGQPSLRAAWRDDGLNLRWGDFYRNTFETLGVAYVRPRHDSAVAFQTQASVAIREALAAGRAGGLIDLLQTLYAGTRMPGSER